MGNRLTNDQFIQRSLSIHGAKFSYINCNYTNGNSKIEVACNNHGFFSVKANDHLRTLSGGCLGCAKIHAISCADAQRLARYEFIERSNTIHNNKYNYSMVDYINSQSHVKIMCPIHGIFEQIPNNHFKYGCEKCSGKSKKSQEEFIIESAIVHQGKYDYSLIDYKGMFEKIKIICKNHGEFEQLPTNHLHGQRGCPKCSKRISRHERMWLTELGLPDNSKHRNVYINVGGKKYFVDGFDATTNTVYEFNGDYWHGNLALYNADDVHPEIQITFGQLWKNTEEKRNNLEAAGYKVISIWESDYIKKYKSKFKIFIHDHKYGQIICHDQELFDKLRTFLSYKPTGIEYTPAYQNGWDGVTYLIDKNGYFLLGLLHKVLDFVGPSACDLIDKRIMSKNSSPIDLSDKLKKLNLEPRDYQNDIVSTALSHQKGIVRACTGSGKTLTTALITAKINKPTIIYVIGLDLLKQFHTLFSSLFKDEIGFIGDGICNIKKINIASIWTIGRALNIKKNIVEDDLIEEADLQDEKALEVIQMLQETKLHIFDESHIITTSTIKAIFDKINPEYIYGFSGTPFRDDGTDLLINGMLGEKIVDLNASRLINDGYLAQPLIKFVKVPKLPQIDTSNYHSVYKQYIVDNEIRNNLIFQHAKELFEKGYQVLILFKTLRHGENIRKLFDEHNISYEYLSGKDNLETRVKVKEKLLSKKSNILLASTILDIGVDIPSLSSLILGGSGISTIRCLQRIGRVIRKHENKKYAAVVDFYDDVKFLKKHSQKRYEVYKSEQGFKLLIPKSIKFK